MGERERRDEIPTVELTPPDPEEEMQIDSTEPELKPEQTNESTNITNIQNEPTEPNILKLEMEEPIEVDKNENALLLVPGNQNQKFFKKNIEDGMDKYSAPLFLKPCKLIKFC